MDFPDDPVLKNLPCIAGEVGSIPGQGARSQVEKQLSRHATVRYRMTQLRSCVLQPRPTQPNK